MSNCWWCCHPFDWEPLHFPYAFVSNVFHTTGYFCSWGCMKAYAIDRAKYNNCELITLMRKRMEGKVTHTKSAPMRQALQMFGGPLTIEEFRSGVPGVTCVKVPGEFLEHTVVLSSAGPSCTSSSEFVKLKREKPLERSKSKLETSLGIIRKKKCTDAVVRE